MDPWDKASKQEMRQRCHARRKDGAQCGMPAVMGMRVCRIHGGGTQAAMAKAKLRMMELVDPAIATIARIMADPNAKASDRLRAAENILDRAGIPRRMELDPELARDILATKLSQILLDTATIEGEVEEDDDWDGSKARVLGKDTYQPPGELLKAYESSAKVAHEVTDET